MRSRSWGPVSVLRGKSGGAVRRPLREQPPAETGRPWTSRRLHTGVSTNVVPTSQDNVDTTCHLAPTGGCLPVRGLTKMRCECPQWSPPACIPFSPSPSISLGSLSRVSSFGLSLTTSSSQSRRGGHRKVGPTISLMSPVVQPLRLAGACDAHILALPTWQHQ